MSAGLVHTILTVVTAYNTLALVTFMLTYHLRTRWWRTDVGRHLMLYAFILTASMLFSLYVLIIDPPSPRDGGWLAVFGGLGLAFTSQLILLYRALHRAPPDDERG